MITVPQFLEKVIRAWEGELSTDPQDPGNWANGLLIGSKYGVTPSVLAKHRGWPVASITPDVMAAVEIGEAVAIGEKQFYREPHFDLLVWCPATASLLDFGWGAGSGQAVKSMQRLVKAVPDGILGPATAKSYNDWLAAEGQENAAQAIHDMRCAFYRQISTSNPVLAKYLKGWTNRADWALKAAA
jgi:lysozyme family protein